MICHCAESSGRRQDQDGKSVADVAPTTPNVTLLYISRTGAAPSSAPETGPCTGSGLPQPPGIASTLSSRAQLPTCSGTCRWIELLSNEGSLLRPRAWASGGRREPWETYVCDRVSKVLGG